MPRLAGMGGGLAIAALLAAPAGACPQPGDRLLFHSCHAASTIELLLLPEEAAALSAAAGTPPAGLTLDITGGYTGTDTRGEGHPNPVGLFVDNGRVVSPNLARMDGILVIDGEGQPHIHLSTQVPLRDGVADLSDPDQRLDFADWASEHAVSVLQSHLLIVDGRLDVRPQLDAPKARRRMLFLDRHGWGIYQTTEAQTLFDAAFELQQRYRPTMAINLDMGSFDYCVIWRDGMQENCGVVGLNETAKLSNVLRLSRRP
jgi:hypothetical protein